ncbi:MAG: hypothetical protein KJZ80_15635 [Hyphomicrobiaceae bacterium]|nr:hypothetical protein [Hyphomicrobiaceae bacterium]
MLGRLVLILLQLAVGWFGAPQVLRYVPVGGDAQIFVYAVAAAIIVWLVGMIGAQVLKDVATPSAGTLAAALLGGLIGAALVVFKINAMVPVNVPPLLWPLGLATLGYALKK